MFLIFLLFIFIVMGVIAIVPYIGLKEARFYEHIRKINIGESAIAARVRIMNAEYPQVVLPRPNGGYYLVVTRDNINGDAVTQLELVEHPFGSTSVIPRLGEQVIFEVDGANTVVSKDLSGLQDHETSRKYGLE